MSSWRLNVRASTQTIHPSRQSNSVAIISPTPATHGFRRIGSWKGKLVFQQFGLQALDGAECDRRGRDSPPRPLPSPGPRAYCEAATATSLEKKVSSSPPHLTHTHTHTHTHTPDMPRTRTRPPPPAPACLMCFPRASTRSPATPFSQVSSACQPQPSIPYSPLPYPLPRRNRAAAPPPPPPIVILARDGCREHRCRYHPHHHLVARSFPLIPPSPLHAAAADSNPPPPAGRSYNLRGVTCPSHK